MSTVDEYLEGMLKDAYLSEIETKNSMVSNLSIPSGVVILLAGVVAFYLKSIPEICSLDLLSVFFYIPLAVMVIALAVTVGFLIRAIYNYKYGYLPSGQKMKAFFDSLNQKAEQYRTSLKSHAQEQANGGGMEETEINAIVDKWKLDCASRFITERYAIAAENNRKQNRRRGACRHRANTWIIVCVCAFIVSLIPYCILFLRVEENQEIVSVRIVNMEDLKMTEQGNGNGGEDSPVTTPEPKEPVTPPPPPPDPPDAPSVEFIREGEFERPDGKITEDDD